MRYQNSLRNSPIYRKHWVIVITWGALTALMGGFVVALMMQFHQYAAMTAAAILALALMLQAFEFQTSAIQFVGHDVYITMGRLGATTEPVPLAYCRFWKRQSPIARLCGYGDLYIQYRQRTYRFPGIEHVDEALEQARVRRQLARAQLATVTPVYSLTLGRELVEEEA